MPSTAKKLPKPDWEGGQRTIFGAARGIYDDDEKDMHPREKYRKERRLARQAAKENQPAGEKPVPRRAKRQIRDKWFQDYEWLKKLEENGKVKITCALCARAISIGHKDAPSSGIGAKPSCNFKVSVLADHALSQEHLRAVKICREADLKGTD